MAAVWSRMSGVAQPWIAPDTPAEPHRSPQVRLDVAKQRRAVGPLGGSPVERLQPRGVGAILDGGFEVLRFRFPLIAALTVTLVAPLMGVPLLVRNLRVQDRLEDMSSVNFNLGFGPATPGEGATWALEQLGGGLALALVGVAIGHLVAAWLRGEDPGYRDVMKLVLRRGPVAAAAWVMALIPKSLGVLACGVGVLFTVSMFVVLSPLVANEAVGPFAAVGRCFKLSSGRRATAMVGFVVCGLCVKVAFGLVGMLVATILESQVLQRPTWGWIAMSAVELGFALLLIPVQAGWASLAYLDLRVRSEGLDIVLESERLFPGTANAR